MARAKRHQVCFNLFMQAGLLLGPGWEIPEAELSFRAVCSGGPGGQNVNKVSTKVQLRFAVDVSQALTPGQKIRLRASFPSHFTRSGELLIVSDETRSQETNKERALLRLRDMILSIRFPARLRKKTKPSRSARERRLFEKKSRGALKKSRQTID